MKRKVAVENSLTNVSDYLRSQGYDVTNLQSNANLDGYDAIVVSGQDKDFMGMEDTLTKSAVVDARGNTPEEVYNQLQQNMR